MVPLGRELVSSHRLSIQTTLVWYRVAAICNASFDWGCQIPSLGEGVVVSVPLERPGYDFL